MASTYTLDTQGKVTPEDKLGPRAAVGCRVLAARDSDGAIAVQIIRGDGGGAEQFLHTVRCTWVGCTANVATEIKLAMIDLGLPDFTPRTYRVRVVADGGATLTVTEAFIAPSPYAPAGIYSA